MVDTRISIKPAQGTWVVRAAGAVIAESNKALILSEADYPPVTYFPREDVAVAFLDASEQTSTCPFKGDANYFHIAAKSRVLENAVWSYESPIDDVKQIAGYLAFYHKDVTVEHL